MDELKKIKVPEAQQQAMLVEAMSGWWLAALGTLVKTLGPEAAMKAYGPAMREIGKQKTAEMVQKMGSPGSDAIGLASLVDFWEEAMGIEGKVIEVSPEKVVKINTKCPMSKTMPEVCVSMECAVLGFSDVLNPEFHMRATHMMTKGDPHCEWVVERKAKSSK
jgi:predicted hydrocarbon binding protein